MSGRRQEEEEGDGVESSNRKPAGQEHKFLNCLVKFMFVQSGNYQPFLRQCQFNGVGSGLTSRQDEKGRQGRMRGRQGQHEQDRDNSEESKICKRNTNSNIGQQSASFKSSALEQLLPWQKWAHHHYILVICLCFYYLIKHVLILSVRYIPSMRTHQYLDCFIIGRFRFVGRTIKISDEIASIYLVVFLLYRVLIRVYLPNYKFYVHEFVLTSHSEVLLNELRADKNGNLMIRRGHRNRKDSVSWSPDRRRDCSMSARHLKCEYSTTNLHHMIPRGRSAASADRRTSAAFRVQIDDSFERLEGRLNDDDDDDDDEADRVNQLFYLPSVADLTQEARCWILRPNRTAKEWLAITSAARMLSYGMLFSWIAFMLVIYYILAGPVLTNLGFELSYPSCVAWLRDVQSAHGTGQELANNGKPELASNHDQVEYAYIYQAPSVLAHEIPIQNLPIRIPLVGVQRINFYRYTRILADVIENHVLYIEFTLIYLAHFGIIVISSYDILRNAAAIKVRLVKLIDKLEDRRTLRKAGEAKVVEEDCHPSRYVLRRHHQDQWDQGGLEGFNFNSTRCNRALRCPWPISSQVRHFLYRDNLLSPSSEMVQGGEVQARAGGSRCGPDEIRLILEISNLQAILADHIETITQGYNLFLSTFTTLIGFTWAGFATISCVWISIVKSWAIGWEFCVAQLAGSTFLLTTISCASLVSSRNAQLYPLITRAMCLDPAWSSTKPRWIPILKLFYPKSLHCFDYFGTQELTWMHCIRVVSWIIGGSIVLATFFHLYPI